MQYLGFFLAFLGFVALLVGLLQHLKGKKILAALPDAHEQGTVDLQPGKYTVNIRDSIPGDAAHFKGGFSFELLVKRTALLAVEAGAPAASASASSSAIAAASGKPTTKAASSAVKPGAAASAKPGAKPAAAASAGKH